MQRGDRWHPEPSRLYISRISGRPRGSARYGLGSPRRPRAASRPLFSQPTARRLTPAVAPAPAPAGGGSATPRRSRCSSRSGRSSPAHTGHRQEGRIPASQPNSVRHRRSRQHPRCHPTQGSNLGEWSVCRGKSHNARRCSDSCPLAYTIDIALDPSHFRMCRFQRIQIRSRGKRIHHRRSDPYLRARGMCSSQSSHIRSE